MTVTLGIARYKEAIEGRDSMGRALAWQGNAGTLYGLNMVYARPQIARGTTAAKVKTVAAVDFVVGGTLFNKGATDDFWTLSGTTVAASSWQKYVLLVSDAGSASIQEATQSTVSAAAVSFGNITASAKAFPANPWAPIISMLASSKAIFGVLTIATDSTHTFIPGTTALNATGITATFVDGIDPLLLPLVYNETGTMLLGRDI